MRLLPFSDSSGVLTYLRENSDGIGGIASSVLSIPSHELKARAVVPDTYSNREPPARLEEACQWSGGLEWLAARVQSLSTSTLPGTFIVQDVWMTRETYPPFSHLHRVEAPAFHFFQSGRPHVATLGAFASYDVLDSICGQCSSFFIFAAFSKHTLNQHAVDENCDVSESEFSSLVEGVVEYYASAYDRESWVVINGAGGLALRGGG